MRSVVLGLSNLVLRVEKLAVVLLTAGVMALILLNVITRAMAQSIFWVDELAIYAMIWLVMIGTSVTLRQRRAISVTLAETCLSADALRVLRRAVDLIVLGFAGGLFWLGWIWFDPPGLVAAGFDFQAFSGATFNFIYQEPTNTVGVPKFVIWLVMPVSAAAMTLHALANLFEGSVSRDTAA